MMTVQDQKVVTLAYTLTDDAGAILDRADSKDPFVYLHGAGQIVPGLESALMGLKVGDEKRVTVQPEEGYGEIDSELKMIVKRTQFPKEAELEVGMQFEAGTPDGQGAIFTVEKLEGDQVHIDGNHPMAGKVLNFSVEVLDVRDPTEDELEHGHAHGPDGHHH